MKKQEKNEEKSNRRSQSRIKIVLVIVVLLICVLGVGCLGYIMHYYHAVDVETYLQSDNAVTVSKISSGYFFDGPGVSEAIIFYPGAKVEETAYAPIMSELAVRGIDCFLVKMPGRLAVLGISKADDIRNMYSYDKWYMMGHSMGGAMAAEYIKSHEKEFDGLIFLGAYSASDLSNAPFDILSVCGSNDQICTKETRESHASNLPVDSQYVILEGGNHGGFGSYGQQAGDGEPKMDAQRQWEGTVVAIVEYIQEK